MYLWWIFWLDILHIIFLVSMIVMCIMVGMCIYIYHCCGPFSILENYSQLCSLIWFQSHVQYPFLYLRDWSLVLCSQLFFLLILIRCDFFRLFLVYLAMKNKSTSILAGFICKIFLLESLHNCLIVPIMLSGPWMLEIKSMEENVEILF